MARNDNPAPKGIAWDAVPGADKYLVYMDVSDDPDFVNKVDAGLVDVHAETVEAQYLFTATDPSEADWAVTAYDEQSGWHSDPLSPASWQDVPLQGEPIPAPQNGRLLFAS